MYLFNLILNLLLVTIIILISVAFLTLMERKFLSYIQIRKGPNKVGFIGLIQPFRDAIKLLSKEIIFINKVNLLIYIYSPILRFILIIIIWIIYPFWVNNLRIKIGLIYLICCLRLGVYGLILSGWASNSSYSLLGSIRSLAQSISYEVRLSIIIIIPILLLDNFNLNNLFYIQKNRIWLIIYIWPLSLIFFFSIIAELNRTPFDFSEGESELVSGFNVEYRRVGFILIFLSEYARILFLRFLFRLFYLGGDYFNLNFYLKILLIVFIVIWIRGSLPRFRYDLLIYICWLIILPFTLNYIFYIILFKIII